MVSRYTDDVKNIKFEIQNYIVTLRNYDADKTLFDLLLNLLNNVDKSVLYSDRSFRKFGGYKLDNIETGSFINKITLTFKSQKQITVREKRKRKKVFKTEILEIDLDALVFK